MTFRDTVRNRGSGVFIYTLTPPSLENGAKSELSQKLAHIRDLTNRVKIDAINIPEVQREERNPRVTQFTPKMDPLNFANEIATIRGQNPELILDKIVVRDSWDKQLGWIETAVDNYSNLLLVGGESSEIDYPGPSVPEAAALISKSLGTPLSYALGGITIPTRRHFNVEELHRDEPHKLLRKSAGGIEFFVSQVIYEAESSICLLKDYSKLIEQHGERPSRLIFSFAPMSVKRDLEFLRWWDVHVPTEAEEYIFSSESGVLDRSIEHCGQILREIIHFIRVENITIPIGVNVEHVSTRNLQNSMVLCEALAEICKQ